MTGYKKPVVELGHKLTVWHIKSEIFAYQWKYTERTVFFYFDGITQRDTGIGQIVTESLRQSIQTVSLFLGLSSWQLTPHSQVLLNTHAHWPEPYEWSKPSSLGLLYWH